MKRIFDLLDEVSHQLNSPLAGAKSYTYLSKRLLEKGDIKKSAKYLELLDKKIDTLMVRIDMLLTALRLERSSVPLTYQLFDIAEITNQNSYRAELMADRDILTRALSYCHDLTGSLTPKVTGNTSTVSVEYPYSKRAESDDKDIRTEFIEKSILIYLLVKTHGGMVKESDTALMITLPLKPPKRK